MASYKRIPGGEKTPKSGTTWSRDELAKVLDLYIKLKGEKIHENNEDIQALARSLERSVRSAEAQLLMFRNLERGGDYSHGNMNKICKQLWEERMSNSQQNCTPDTTDCNSGELIYPNAFENWFGKGSGSVKRPFAENTGRPLGCILKTPLLERLGTLAEDIANGSKEPKIVMLAGGAGNGKSDALEEFLKAICEHAGTSENGLPALKSSFAAGGRKVEISGSDLLSPEGWLKDLAIIQDATEGDDTGDSTGSLLAEDVESACASDGTLLVVCVNRGILEDARLYAQKQELEHAVPLINDCIEALNPLNIDLPCWPLKEHRQVYLWPLDIASLADGDCPVIEQVLEAVAEGNWNESALHEDSPIICNLGMLKDEGFRSNLTRILRHHEVLSGQRWTFREVFHLVAHLMTGGRLRDDGETPVECAVRLVPSLTGSVKQEVASAFDACRATIPHVLFAEWPSYKNFQLGVEKLAQEVDRDLLQYSKALYEYLQKHGRNHRSKVERMLSSSFRENLDPAAGMSLGWELEIDGGTLTEGRLDDAFSTSVGTGLELVRLTGALTSPETAAMRILEKVESELEEVVDGTVASSAIMYWKNSLYWLRRLANIMCKRSLAAFTGKGRKSHHAIRFLDTINSPELMDAEKDGITSILEDDGSYVVPLSLSLGQPRGTAQTPPLFRIESPRISKGRNALGSDLRPSGLYREFHAVVTQGRTVVIPYTLELFCRLRMLEEGLLEGCLDGMARGCLDQLRLALDGHAVRAWGRETRIEIDLGDALGKFTGYSDELRYKPVES